MRILILSLLIISCFLTECSAQQIWINGGAAIPSGSYSNTNLQKSEDKFASTGSFVSLEIKYPVVKNIGISVQGGFSSQAFNADEYNRQLAENITGVRNTITANAPYKSSFMLAGAYIGFPKGKFNFSIDAGLGFIHFTAPSYKMESAYPSNTGTTFIESQSDMGMLFSWGLSASYQLPKGFLISAMIRNFSSELQLNALGYASSQPQTSTLKFEIYTPGLGIGYTF